MEKETNEIMNEMVLYDRIETMYSFFDSMGKDKKYFLAVIDDDEQMKKECFALRTMIGKMMREKKLYTLDLKEFPMHKSLISQYGRNENSDTVLLYGNADGVSECLGSYGKRVATYNPLSACTHEWVDWYIRKMDEK